MNRPPSRGTIRRTAIRAFHERVRFNLQAEVVRPPEAGETPLSPDEIAFAVSRGLALHRSTPRAPARFAEGAA